MAPLAGAGLDDETALAKRFSPVVRLVEQPEECGPGEPYEPIDVNLLFGEPGVALRGPWNPTDLVKIAPGAEDLVGLDGYHLDFPGNALDPGCTYERWDHRLREGSAPTVYAHVATDPGHPGEVCASVLALLRLQRLQQSPRGRLGDDPARLRGRGCPRSARRESGLGRVHLPRRRRARRLGRREARDRGWHPSRCVPGRRLARERVHRSPLPRELGRRGGRLRRHSRATPGAAAGGDDHLERAGYGRESVSVDRLRGALGGAAESLLQRSDGPQPEAAVVGADRVVRKLAGAKLRSAFGPRLRSNCDRLLLRGRGAWLARPRSAPPQPRRGGACDPCFACPLLVRRDAHDLATERARAGGEATSLGPGAFRRAAACT